MTGKRLTLEQKKTLVAKIDQHVSERNMSITKACIIEDIRPFQYHAYRRQVNGLSINRPNTTDEPKPIIKEPLTAAKLEAMSIEAAYQGVFEERLRFDIQPLHIDRLIKLIADCEYLLGITEDNQEIAIFTTIKKDAMREAKYRYTRRPKA